MVGMPKRFRHHTDHGIGHPIEDDGFTDPVRPAVEMLPPKIVTDDDNACSARLAFCRDKIASKDRWQSDDLEKIRGDQRRWNILGRLAWASAEGETGAGSSSDSGENIAAVFAPLSKGGWCKIQL